MSNYTRYLLASAGIQATEEEIAFIDASGYPDAMVGLLTQFHNEAIRKRYEMKKETIEQFIWQLDGMIAALQQAVVIGGRTQEESEACELLKDARLKLVEAIEKKEE